MNPETQAYIYLKEIGYTDEEITDSLVEEMIESTYADSYNEGRYE